MDCETIRGSKSWLTGVRKSNSFVIPHMDIDGRGGWRIEATILVAFGY